MASTGHPTADQRTRWHRIELTGWAIVAVLSAASFAVLVTFTQVRPLLAFLGIVVALDLPFCIDLIWRAGRQDAAASAVGKGTASRDPARP